MDPHTAEPLCFRIYGDYQGPGPVFHSREECPWLAAIESHWRTIRAEFEDYEDYYYRAAFPRTVAILRAISHLTSAFVNLLEPHAKLHPHNGDTNTTYRGHDRVVLVFDVMKPAYRPRKLRICGAVLGAITVTALETRWPALRRLPATARRALHRVLGVAASAAVALEREPADGGLPDTAVPR